MKEQELGYLVAKAISFVKHKKGMPVYLKHVDGLHQDIIDMLLTKDSHENGIVCLPDGKYHIGIGNPYYTIELGKSLLGDKTAIRHLYLKKDTCEFVVGHSDSGVFLREEINYQWKRVRLQGKPSLGKLVQDVMHEASGIPTIVARGYDNATKKPGSLRTLGDYQPLESQQTQ